MALKFFSTPEVPEEDLPRVRERGRQLQNRTLHLQLRKHRMRRQSVAFQGLSRTSYDLFSMTRLFVAQSYSYQWSVQYRRSV